MNKKYTPEKALRLFWSRVDMSGGPDSCWEWQAYRYPAGYGRATWRGKTRLAHRLSYEIAYGSCPNDLVVRHDCDNPSCVNPRHLLIGTQQENISDRVSKGRSRYAKGIGNGAAKLTDFQVSQIRHLWCFGGSTQRKIAALFGISQTTVSEIVNRKYRL